MWIDRQNLCAFVFFDRFEWLSVGRETGFQGATPLIISTSQFVGRSERKNYDGLYLVRKHTIQRDDDKGFHFSILKWKAWFPWRSRKWPNTARAEKAENNVRWMGKYALTLITVPQSEDTVGGGKVMLICLAFSTTYNKDRNFQISESCWPSSNVVAAFPVLTWEQVENRSAA